MLKEILTKESIDEYFANNKDDIKNFTRYLILIIKFILETNISKLDQKCSQICLEIILNLYNIFLKFHKNKNYVSIYDLIRIVFNYRILKHNFFEDTHSKIKYDYNEFNFEYNSEFSCNNKQKERFQVGDIVDIPIEYDQNRTIDKFCWVRGKIKSLEKEGYIIEYQDFHGAKEKKINFKDLNIYPCGIKTIDWDWRTNLKQWDLIDCYDRNRWYPSTVISIEEEDKEGIKYVAYHVGFRIYPEHFNNLDYPDDIAKNHISIWDNQQQLEVDSNGDYYYGDREGFDERIPMFSKRIQKFNTFSKYQLKNLDYTFNPLSNDYFSKESEDSNLLKIMNNNLYSDTYLLVEEFYKYNKNGKKNIIIGKQGNFSYYFAILLKLIEKENGFEKMIDILLDNPNSDEIYTVLFILYNCFNYIHIDFFKEKASLLGNAFLEFINNLDDKEMKELPKDFRSLVIDFFHKINKEVNSDKNKYENNNFFNQIILNIYLREIKTSNYNIRSIGIEDLNKFIEANKKNKKITETIIKLIKKNELIQEIFGANYHSKIINKSEEIIKLLLIEDQLNNEDIELIWNCTRKGDSELKSTILTLLSVLAEYLKKDYVKMLLNNIKITADTKKITDEEFELLYKLYLHGNENESQENLLTFCEYLCYCLLSFPVTKISNSPILEKLIIISEKGDIYLKKIFEICENHIKKNDKAIICFSILLEIIERINPKKIECLNILIKDDYLLNLFQDNFKLYNQQAIEIMEKNNILYSNSKSRDEFIINGFSHSENLNKRIEILNNLIKYLYKNYDFIPFLKEVLITKAVSPNDKLIFEKFEKEAKKNK